MSIELLGLHINHKSTRGIFNSHPNKPCGYDFHDRLLQIDHSHFELLNCGNKVNIQSHRINTKYDKIVKLI